MSKTDTEHVKYEVLRVKGKVAADYGQIKVTSCNVQCLK